MSTECLAMNPYAPVLVLILVVIGFIVVILALSHWLGPKRRGPVKDTVYEAGMSPIHDARRQFNVKFYLVALVFLLFDVEVVFMWPWAPLFHQAAMVPHESPLVAAGYERGFLLIEMALFVMILLVGYAYAWRRGVFKWT